MTILIRLSSIYLMSGCRECSSTETTVVGDLSYCASCGVQVGDNFDRSKKFVKTEESKTKDDWSNIKNPRLKKAILYDRRAKNKKSIPHKEGLIEIENYQNYYFSGKKDFSNNLKFPLIKESISLFEQGISLQTKKTRETNEKAMFMPSGLRNAPLFAAYASLLYAQRSLSGDWNSGLKHFSEHIHENIQPKNLQGKKLTLNEVKSQVRLSFKRLKILLSRDRVMYNRNHKSSMLKDSFSRTVTLYTQSIDGRTSNNVLISITEIEDKIDLGVFREKLELIIPQSGLDLVSAEMLYQLIKEKEPKTSRVLIKEALGLKKRISDKQQVVREIYSIIGLEMK